MRIIILDDNFGIADSLRMALEHLGGHNVAVVTRQLDVIEAAERNNPDAFVFDFLLPGDDIKTTINRIKSFCGAINFVFFTLYATDRLKREKMMEICKGDDQRIIQKEPDLADCASRILAVLERDVKVS
jgi:CheY-like chemotaxis protein